MSTPIFDSVNEKPVTTDANGEPTNKPVAKVQNAALFTVLATIAVAALTAVTPEMLSFAGQWTPVVYAAVGGVVATLAAYLKRPVG